MADTTTTHYGLVKPEPSGSPDTWGTKLNTDLDTIDTQMKANADAAAAALPKSGGTMTGHVLFDSPATCGSAAKPAAELHGAKLSIHPAGGAEVAGIDISGNGTFLDVTITSDRRWKENIENADAKLMLEAVLKVPAVHFDWKENNETRSLGLIAQDVDRVIPDAVRFVDGRMYLRPQSLIAALFACVQEQQRQINELRSKLK